VIASMRHHEIVANRLKDQVLKFIFDVLEKEDYENFDIIK